MASGTMSLRANVQEAEILIAKTKYESNCVVVSVLALLAYDTSMYPLLFIAFEE